MWSEISSSQAAHTFTSYHFTSTEPCPEPVIAIPNCPSVVPTDSTKKCSLINQKSATDGFYLHGDCQRRRHYMDCKVGQEVGSCGQCPHTLTSPYNIHSHAHTHTSVNSAIALSSKTYITSPHLLQFNGLAYTWHCLSIVDIITTSF